MTNNANVFFDFLLQKSLAGTLPATLAPFADRFTRQTADLANARLRPFCTVQCSAEPVMSDMGITRNVLP